MFDINAGILFGGIAFIAIGTYSLLNQKHPRLPKDGFLIDLFLQSSDDELESTRLEKRMELVLVPRIGDTINLGFGRSCRVEGVVYYESQWPTIVLKQHPLPQKPYQEMIDELISGGWVQRG